MAKKDPIPLNYSKLATPDATAPNLLAAISHPRVAAVVIAVAALVAYHNSFSGPLIFAELTESGVVGDTVLAFRIGASLMCAAGLVAAFLAVRAEQRSLEDIAEPLSARSSA